MDHSRIFPHWPHAATSFWKRRFKSSSDAFFQFLSRIRGFTTVLFEDLLLSCGRDCDPSCMIFTSTLGGVVMSSSSTHHPMCAPIPEIVASSSSLILGFFVVQNSPSNRLGASRPRPRHLLAPSSLLRCHLIALADDTLVFLADCRWHSPSIPLFIRGLTSAHRHQSYKRTDGADAVLCCRLKNWTCFIEAVPHVHRVETIVFTTSMIVVPSRELRVGHSHPRQRRCQTAQFLSCIWMA